MSAARNLVWSAVLGTGILLLCLGCTFLVWPTWLTGGYCEYTFTRLQLDPDGRVEIDYDETLAYGTFVEWVTIPDARGISSSSSTGWRSQGGFLRWPRRWKDQRKWTWITTSEEKGEPPEYAVLARRLILKPGTYRIRVGETMVYCREVYADGRVAEGRIRVKAD